jgi:RNA polymerase sigma factor (sigma-70 family)
MMPMFRREVPDAAWEDERLVNACLEGQAAAWEALIQKYKRLIYSVPFRYGATSDDASDIFQAVCVDLYAELPKLRKVGSLRSWLMTVAARQSLKWKQSRQRHAGEDVDLSQESDPLAVAGPEWSAQLERNQIVGEALARLTERCRALIERLFFDDPPKPYDVVARELGLATGSMGLTRSRCLDKLRKALEELGYK